MKKGISLILFIVLNGCYGLWVYSQNSPNSDVFLFKIDACIKTGGATSMILSHYGTFFSKSTYDDTTCSGWLGTVNYDYSTCLTDALDDFDDSHSFTMFTSLQTLPDVPDEWIGRAQYMNPECDTSLLVSVNFTDNFGETYLGSDTSSCESGSRRNIHPYNFENPVYGPNKFDACDNNPGQSNEQRCYNSTMYMYCVDGQVDYTSQCSSSSVCEEPDYPSCRSLEPCEEGYECYYEDRYWCCDPSTAVYCKNGKNDVDTYNCPYACSSDIGYCDDCTHSPGSSYCYEEYTVVYCNGEIMDYALDCLTNELCFYDGDTSDCHEVGPCDFGYRQECDYGGENSYCCTDTKLAKCTEGRVVDSPLECDYMCVNNSCMDRQCVENAPCLIGDSYCCNDNQTAAVCVEEFGENVIKLQHCPQNQHCEKLFFPDCVDNPDDGDDDVTDNEDDLYDDVDDTQDDTQDDADEDTQDDTHDDEKEDGVDEGDSDDNNVIAGNNMLGLGIGLGVGIPVALIVVIGVLVCVIVLVVCLLCRSQKSKQRGKDSEMEDFRNSTAEIVIDEKLFEIKRDKIKLEKIIGSGGSDTTIYKATWEGTAVAVKMFKISSFQEFERDCFKEFEREVSLMSSISHLNLIRFYGCTLESPSIGMVIQFCEHGDLKSYLTLNKELELQVRIGILQGVSNGMAYLHDEPRCILHRDLKSENVLLDSTLTPKIIDFGLSRIINNTNVRKTSRVGTCFYMSPEISLGKNYDFKCDVFSYSIIIWEVLENNFQPYGNINSLDFAVEMKVANDEKYRPVMKDESVYPGWIILMMKNCWKQDPQDRPTFFEIREIFQKNIVAFE